MKKIGVRGTFNGIKITIDATLRHLLTCQAAKREVRHYQIESYVALPGVLEDYGSGL